MPNKIFAIGQNTVKYIALALVIYLCIGASVTHIYDTLYIEAYVKTHNIFYNIASLAMFVLLFIALVTIPDNKWHPISNQRWNGICLGLICIQVFFFAISIPIPASDQMNIFAAIAELRGSPTGMPLSDSYWKVAPHVFANVVYQGVFGIHFYFFYLYNLLLYIGMYIMMMKMTNDSRVTAASFVLAVPITSYIFMYYGEMTALFAIVASIYLIRKFYTGNFKWFHFVEMGLITFFAYWEKNNFLIFIIADVLTVILFMFRYKKTRLNSICLVAIMLLSAISVKPVVNTLAKNIYGIEMGEYLPITYVAMGMHEISQSTDYDYNTQIEGGFDGTNHAIVVDNNFDSEKIELLCRTDIQRRLIEFKYDPIKMVRFYNNKALKQWTTPDWSTNWTIKLPKMKNLLLIKDYKDNVNENTDDFDYSQFRTNFDRFQDLFSKGMLISVYAFVAYYLIKHRKENLQSEDIALLALFIGNFIFSMIWEAKPRYCIYGYFALIAFTCLQLSKAGVSKRLDKINNIGVL